MKGLVFALLGLLTAAPASAAEIYKWILPDGSVAYSDQPPEEGAKKVELSPLVTYTPTPISTSQGQTEAQEKKPFEGYKRFRIASPSDDAAIRDNGGNVNISFDISPALVDGHGIEIFVDGEPFGRISVPVVTLNNVSRGSHRIYAIVVDDAGVTLARSAPVTVHLQRASVAGTAAGGARSPGGPGSPGGPRNPGGPVNPGGPASPGGPKSGGGATP